MGARAHIFFVVQRPIVRWDQVEKVMRNAGLTLEELGFEPPVAQSTAHRKMSEEYFLEKSRIALRDMSSIYDSSVRFLS